MDIIGDDGSELQRQTLAEQLVEAGVQARASQVSIVLPDLIISAFEQIVVKKKPALVKRSRERFNEAKLKHQSKKNAASLIVQAHGECPFPGGCSRPLAIPDDSDRQSYEANYQVVQIHQSEEDLSVNNLIVLCPTHAVWVNDHRDEAMENRLQAVKEKLIQDLDVATYLSNVNVAEEVYVVIACVNHIADDTETVDYEQNYDPVELRLKIRPGFRSLLRQATSLMNEHYEAVATAYQAKIGDGEVNWRRHAKTLQHAWDLLQDQYGLQQDEIFEHLVALLMERSKKDRYICTITVSFYIQKCVVFAPFKETIVETA